MNKFFTSILLLFACACAYAQAPQKMTYQSVVHDANNSLVDNRNVSARIWILHGGADGAAVYIETQTATTNANGLMTLVIGEGTVVSGSLANIDWADGPYFLKAEVDPAGGSSYTQVTVQELLSVPYALYAEQAGNGFSGDYNDLVNTPDIPTVPTHVSAFTNDAGYITSAQCGDVTICDMANLITSLQSMLGQLQSQLGQMQSRMDALTGETGETVEP